MNQEKIGKFIAQKRKEKKLTQEELAEMLNVNSRSISRWENGKCLPDISLYNSICEILGVTINELLSGEKIDKREYQDKFEQNIIDVVSDIETKNKIIRKTNIIILFIVVFIISLFIFNFLFKNIYLKRDYKKNLVNVSYINNIIELEVPNLGDLKYAYFNYNNECLVFTTYYENIESIIMKHKNFSDFIGYDMNEIKDSHELYLGNSCKKPVKIYYTKTKFSSINKAYENKNLSKLNKIIDNSKLLYEVK